MNWKKHVTGIAVLVTASTGAGVAAAQPQHMGPPPAQVVFPEGEKVVEIPFEFVRNKIIIPVSVNGSKTLPFVLDTGAPIAVLKNKATAKDLNLTMMGKARVGGAGEGETQEVDLAGNVTFTIGKVRVTGGTMAVGLGETHLSGGGFEGVIGAPIFKNLVVDLDFSKNVMKLYPPESYTYSGKGQALPIQLVYGSFPYVTGKVSIDGAPAEETSFVIDTGAGHALAFMPDTDGSLPVPKDARPTVLGWGANGVLRGSLGRITSLELGPYRFENVVTGFANGHGTHALPTPEGVKQHANLGARLLRRFHVVFDYSRERVILEPNGSYDEPFRANNTGLMPKPFEPGAEALEVFYVMENSPATEAGVEVGDSITAIDGKPVSKYGVDAIGDLVEQDAGTKLTLTIQRGGKQIEKTLTLRRLI